MPRYCDPEPTDGNRMCDDRCWSEPFNEDQYQKDLAAQEELEGDPREEDD